jgi:hypothetical protein
MTGNICARLPFDCFADYVDAFHRIWPLCYTKCILSHYGYKELLDIEAAIKVYSSTMESGKDWEMITIANFYLVAMDAMYNLNKRPDEALYKSGPLDIADGKVCGVKVITIRPEVQTFADLKKYVEEELTFKKGHIIILTPSYSKFPLIDGLIGYVKQQHESNSEYSVKWKAFQNKVSRRYPRKEVPDWIEESILLSGHASKTTFGSSLPRWIHYNESQMKDMLCYSLRPLYPKYWGQFPETDNFDDV